MLVIYLFWSTKIIRSDFSQKWKNELLILHVYTPVVFGKLTSLASFIIEKYLYNKLEVVRKSFY